MPQAHKKSGGQHEQALGRSRGGFSTKVHMSVDGLGNPLRLRLTAAQPHDITQAPELVDGLRFEYRIADRAYAAQDFLDLLAQPTIQPVIPSRPNAKHPRVDDPWLYRERHLLECFINKIQHFRPICSRFDKLACPYLRFLQFLSVLVCLR